MADLDDEDEFTELLGAQFSRIDLVRAPANGSPGFLVMKQDESAGLLDADYVRDLIAKSEPESPGEQVTMTGSPAAIAALIHNASVAKAKNDTASRKHDAATGAAMKDGSYPIENEADLGKAIHAVGRGGSSHNAIRAHIIRRARSLGASSKIPDNWNSDGSLKGGSVSKADTVAKDAGDMLDAQTDDGVDGMDPTVPLASPDDDAPGDPTDPGSPAWEAIDAATASKWCSILSRARVALDLLSERELLEAASADPGDQGNAWDLQDACCAIDYVVSVLAPYAVSEQSEADCGGDDLMAAIGKAMAEDWAAPLTTIEGIGAVIRKSGRVLSAVNESEIRSAAASLNKVLQTLPQAPIAPDDIAKEETAVADGQTPDKPQDVAKADQSAPEGADTAEPADVAKDAAPDAPGTAEDAPAAPVAKAALPGGLQVAVFDRAGAVCLVDPANISQQIAKADAADGDGDGAKGKMVAVFDSKGTLVGVCDPADITPVAGADAPAANDGKSDDGAKPADAAPAPAADDMTPAPAASAGTPADDVAKETGTEPAAKSGGEDDPQDVLKSIVTAAMHEVLGADPAKEDIRKQADVIAKQSEEIEALKARLETVENTPAAPKVFTNGATPPPGTLRGQDRGAGGQPVDVAKARERKAELYAASGPDQARIAREMTQEAVAVYEALHAG
jgi:hypothetical protein